MFFPTLDTFFFSTDVLFNICNTRRVSSKSVVKVMVVVMVLNCLIKRWEDISIVKPTRCTISQIYFILEDTLHVSDGLSVHHQESKTVHTASGKCHTGSVATC